MEHIELEMTPALDDGEVKKRPARGCWKMGCRTFLVFAICGVTSLVGLILYLSQGIENLDVTAYTVPCSVEKGDLFAIEVEMINIGDEDAYVAGFSFDEVSIFDGAKLEGTNPLMAQEGTEESGLTFIYDQIIPVGETKRATIQLEATEVGEFEGLMTVYASKTSLTAGNVYVTIVEPGSSVACGQT